MSDPDGQLRLAAFDFLERQVALANSDGAVEARILQKGFEYDGIRIPLMFLQQGIFKPKAFTLPLSIQTTPVMPGRDRPYDDVMGADNLLRYKYRGTDPEHRDNRGLREAMKRRVPLVYLHGIYPGVYVPEWPVYVVADDPSALTFTVAIDERRFVSLGSLPADDVEIRRRYSTRITFQRLHQREFRERVVRAYQSHCAVCRLRRQELLEAAHIIGDREPQGVPAVRNGLSLCTLHHAAFDADLIGIRPDYTIEVRKDLLDEKDGPMLIHGLQGFHRKELWVPHVAKFKPDRELLETKFVAFMNRSF